MPILESVDVDYLLPNTTSKLQSCDAGIIAALECCCRRFQEERSVDLSEEVVEDIYKSDMLTAMLSAKQIWKELRVPMIRNS